MVFLVKLVDKHFGSLLCNIFSAFSRDKEIVNEGISRILIVQLWGIGETVLTLPAVSALRKKFPDAEINVLATSRNKDVFFNNKNINKVLEVKISPFSV